MTRNGTNGSDVRLLNRVAILRLVNEKKYISRKEIAQTLNLTPATISNITGDLIREGTLVECGVRNEESKSGRKEILLQFNTKQFKVLGAYVATNKVEIFCMNLNEDMLFNEQLDFDNNATGSEIFGGICDAFEKYLESVPAEEKKSIIGIGVELKGIVDSKEGISKCSFGLWEDNFDVAGFIQKRLPYKVIVNNNVKSMAYAEHLFSGNLDDDMIFIKYGPLIGSAFVSKSEIYDGNDYQAMNMGHFIADINGNICRCGRRGCLETVIGFDVMAKLLEVQYSSAFCPVLYRLTDGDQTKIDMETMLQSYDNGDENVCRIVDRSMEYLAVAIVNLISTVNPKRIVFYGRPFESEKYYNELLKKINERAADINSTILCKSIRNMALEHLGCISIVLKDFVGTGAVFE